MADPAQSQHSPLLTLSLELSGAQTDGVVIYLVKQTFLFIIFLQASMKKKLLCREKNQKWIQQSIHLRPILTDSIWHKGFSDDIASDPWSNMALAYELKDAASVTNHVRKIPAQGCCRWVCSWTGFFWAIDTARCQTFDGQGHAHLVIGVKETETVLQVHERKVQLCGRRSQGLVMWDCLLDWVY